MEASVLVEVDEENENLDLIREQSRTWSAEQWEEYLKTIEVGLKESQCFEFWTLDDATRLNFVMNSNPDLVLHQVQMFLHTLSEQQRTIIKKIYFDGNTTTQVAETLSITRQAVVAHKKRAIRKLRKVTAKMVVNFPIAEMPTVSPEELSDRVRDHKEEDLYA